MHATDSDALREMAASLVPAVQGSVIPIGAFRSDGADPHPVGTGTLFAVADTKFIVSVAHVIEAVDTLSGMGCAFVPGEKGVYGTRLSLVPVTGTAYRVGELPDVAVMVLSEVTAAAMSQCHFLRLNEVAVQPELAGCGWVSGFPHERIRALGRLKGTRATDTRDRHSRPRRVWVGELRPVIALRLGRESRGLRLVGRQRLCDSSEPL